MATIKVQTWGEDQGDFVLIDEENFDEDFHILYEEDKQKTIEEMLLDIESLKAEELKKVCSYLEIEYTGKKEAIEAIKLKTENGE